LDVINLRSDTQTLPTPEMMEAIRTAPLGDDTYGEDPTVKRLEAMAAEMLGKEAAILCISGNMANLACLMAHGGPGDEAVIDPDSHIFYYEVGGLASVAGLMPMPVPSRNGRIAPEDVKSAVRAGNLHYPIPRLLCLENTHNRSGGRVTPLALHNELCDTAHELGLTVHLDGARIFNAAIAQGVPASAYAERVDTLMFCLSKGLSCPLGSVAVGSREMIARADRARKRLGGGMRQAGVIAACGIVALETMVDRLADDHANARLLAEAINGIPGLSVAMDTVETNMVYVDHSATGLDTSAVLARLKAAGVLASGRPPRHIRLVTHRHYGASDMAEAVARIRCAMERR
jgi:threonine aldolase